MVVRLGVKRVVSMVLELFVLVMFMVLFWCCGGYYCDVSGRVMVKDVLVKLRNNFSSSVCV